jgi:hypothetical protein
MAANLELGEQFVQLADGVYDDPWNLVLTGRSCMCSKRHIINGAGKLDAWMGLVK